MPRKKRGSTPDLRMRRGTVADAAMLVEHRVAMFHEIRRVSRAEMQRHAHQFRRWMIPRLRRGELVALVVEAADGSVLGSGCLWFQPATPRPGSRKTSLPYVLSMFTARRARRRGVATAIVRRFIDLTARRGYGRISLHASTAGRPVYRRLGFERTYEMRRTLRRPTRPRSA